MPIYEFACPKCRVIFNFLSKRLKQEHPPTCPKCGNKKMEKQMSVFAMPRGAKEPSSGAGLSAEGPSGMPDVDDARMERFMSEMESDMAHLDENNPKHMAHMMRKMKDILPANSVPKEMDVAIKRLEAGEDPEKIEEDMGDLLGGVMGDDDRPGSFGGSRPGGYTRDSGLYDY
jgi:putative FmdB family regulatory protein